MRLLELRGVEVPTAVAARILECADLDRLDRWLGRAAVATTAAEVVEPD